MYWLRSIRKNFEKRIKKVEYFKITFSTTLFVYSSHFSRLYNLIGLRDLKGKGAGVKGMKKADKLNR